MNFEKVVFGFFIVLALTLNFGFFVGDIDNPEHHHALELGAVSGFVQRHPKPKVRRAELVLTFHSEHVRSNEED